MIEGMFAAILRTNRDEFNGRFANARHRFPNLDAHRFGQFLDRCVAPVAQTVEKAQPDAVVPLVFSAFDVGLELVGQNLINPVGTDDVQEKFWRCILPQVAPLPGFHPEIILPAISNALFHLTSAPGARPDAWIESLVELIPDCGDGDTLLKVGQVLAWRCGLARFRQSALQVAQSLPEKLALMAFDADPEGDWPEIKARLDVDPWFDPSVPPKAETSVESTHVGSFRGLGGVLVEPPLVSGHDQGFLVLSGPDRFVLMADCFGHTFRRVIQEIPIDASPDMPDNVSVKGTSVQWGEQVFHFPDLGCFSSVAFCLKTLAVTSPDSHHIVLLGLR